MAEAQEGVQEKVDPRMANMTAAERDEAGHAVQEQWERNGGAQAPKVDRLAWFKKFFRKDQKSQA